MMKKLLFKSLFIVLLVLCVTSVAFADEEYDLIFVDDCGAATNVPEMVYSPESSHNITKAKEGEIVQIYCVDAPEGMTFDHWIIDGVETDNHNRFFDFVMPDHDVTFDCTYSNAITRIELSKIYDSEPVYLADIPECDDITITKVNGGTELLDKVNLVYAKWQKVTNQFDNNDATRSYLIWEDPQSQYGGTPTFEAPERYVFVCKFEILDDDYAFDYNTYVTFADGISAYFIDNGIDKFNTKQFSGYINHDFYVASQPNNYVVMFYSNQDHFIDGNTYYSVEVPNNGSAENYADYVRGYIETPSGYVFERWGNRYRIGIFRFY